MQLACTNVISCLILLGDLHSSTHYIQVDVQLPLIESNTVACLIVVGLSFLLPCVQTVIELSFVQFGMPNLRSISCNKDSSLLPYMVMSYM